jgi:hypothetical protein
LSAFFKSYLLIILLNFEGIKVILIKVFINYKYILTLDFSYVCAKLCFTLEASRFPLINRHAATQTSCAYLCLYIYWDDHPSVG